MGQGASWGIKAAIEDINAQGGVSITELGKKVPVRLIPVMIKVIRSKPGHWRRV